MKKALTIALGILTAVGGFFDIGNIATSIQAGASFHYQLIWSLLLATVLVIFLVEMSGRFAAVSAKALPDAIRDHFGFGFWLFPFLVLFLVHLLVLASEIGGICFALQLITGIPTALWALPVGVLIWLFLWRSSFAAIENSSSLLGLMTLCFVAAAVAHKPEIHELLSGALPSLPRHDPMQYWLIAVGIVGSVIAPYLFYFYSSGAVEDKWDPSYVPVNRAVSVIGMGFGSIIALGALVVAAQTLGARHIELNDYNQAAMILTDAFPFWGYMLFAISMAISCLGAATEVALSSAYTTAQTFGWNWGEDLNPRSDSRFSVVYTGAILLASLLICTGIDPLKLTLLTMVLTAAVLPVVTVPFLLLMNDRALLGKHVNGPLSNLVVIVIVVLSFVLAVVSLPLAIRGGS